MKNKKREKRIRTNKRKESKSKERDGKNVEINQS